MYIRKWQEISEVERQHMLKRSESDIAAVLPDVERIVAAVRKFGDEELRRLNTRFNRTPTNLPLQVPDSEFKTAEKSLSREVKKALEYSVENVRRYHMDQEPDGLNWKEIRPGIMAGERTIPLDSVAFYVPRARGSFPSMLYMMAVPARVAGVGRLSMASPPDEQGQVDPACLYVARLCGIEEVYAMGGAQAWAAFACGTQSVKRVHKCLGPGSKYVAAAKRLLSNVMDCGLPAGPSESVILADKMANVEDTARNLLVEAEHGEDSSALLITDSEDLGRAVDELLPELIEALPEPRRGYVSRVMENYGGILLVENITEGIEVVNEFATEHLQIYTQDPIEVLGRIRHAGEIILGGNIPFSAANYSVGANAVLPTGGHARTWSGVSVRDFKKRSSVIYLTREGFANILPHAQALAEYEGFPAHLNALKYKNERSKTE